MTDRLNEDAWEIRKLVREAEGVTDEAIAAYAKLKLAIVAARRNPEIGVGIGHTALVRLNRAEQSVSAGYGDLLRVHAELSRIAAETANIDEGLPTDIKPGGSVEPLTEAA